MNRILHELHQQSPEWHAFRLTHQGASEAAAMLGLSPYVSRSELLRQKATGIAPEVDPYTQSLFNAGHAAEAAARPMAEAIIGDTLYPATYSYGTLSASCDGLTMGGELAFEHKLHSADLAASVKRGELPDEHQPQCQQVMLVTGAEQVLFMVSDGTPENCVHMFVKPDQAWFDRIQAGWAQFSIDLAAYQPVEVIPAAVAAPTMQLPALSIQVKGEISLIDNLKVFGAELTRFIAAVPQNPSTDQEFADAEAAIKTLEKAQTALEAAEAGALAQTASIDEMRRTVALYAGQARTTRLMLTRLVKNRKESIRFEIVQGGKDMLAAHVATLTKRLGKPYMPVIPADFAGAIKGKGGGKNPIASLRNSVDTELARAKIEANAIADRIGLNLNTLRELGSEYKFLFADVAQIVLKEPDDLAALVKVRIADHAASEVKRLEAERSRIRAEEAAKLLAEQQAKETASQPANVTAPGHPAQLAGAAVPIKPVVTLTASGKVIPSDTAIIHAVAVAFQVDDATALEWICVMFGLMAAGTEE